MAKVKLKFGDNEIEIDSRDFYIDNQTLGQVIENLSNYLQENQAKIITENENNKEEKISETARPNLTYFNHLEDAETYEPEFHEPTLITGIEIKNKLRFLEVKSFFDTPRTVSETVEQLREYGWSASPLDVSKILTKMAFNKEIIKDSRESRNYFVKESILTN